MASQSCHSFCTVALFFFCVCNALAEIPPANQALKKIDVSDGKPKRQNSAGGGEEVDLSVVSPGQAGIPGSPQQPGQSPFGNGNPFLQQQPFFGNALGYPGGQQGGFPGVQQGSYPGLQQGYPGLPQGSYPGLSSAGYPQQGFPQGYPQLGGFQGRNVILQNNGRQYLVQELSDSQRIVQKNGKQYLLQTLTGSGAGSAGLNGLQIFNAPNAALAGLTTLPYSQSEAPNGLGGGLLPGAPSSFPGGIPSGRLASPTSQRLILNGNGQQFQIEQSAIRPSPSDNYFTQGLGGVTAQLAAQASGQPYTSQYSALAGLSNGGLAQAYSRANEAGYGLYHAGRADLDPSQMPAKRNTKGISSEERKQHKA